MKKLLLVAAASLTLAACGNAPNVYQYNGTFTNSPITTVGPSNISSGYPTQQVQQPAYAPPQQSYAVPQQAPAAYPWPAISLGFGFGIINGNRRGGWHHGFGRRGRRW